MLTEFQILLVTDMLRPAMNLGTQSFFKALSKKFFNL